MATQMVAATGGNWSSAATWSPGSVPAAGDDVVLGATSGQLTIDVNTNTIRSLVCTGYTGTITHNAAVTLNIGGSSAPVGNIALLFVGTETYTLGSPTTSAIAIADTSGATNTYNFAGLTIGNLTITNGSTTISQLVTNGFTSAGTITLTSGGFSTNGQTCSWGLFSSSNSNTRTLTMGASVIAITGSGTVWAGSTITNLTITTNTAVITISNGTTLTMGSVNLNGASLVINSPGTVSVAAMTCANFTYNPTSGVANILSYAGNITVSNNLTYTGVAAPDRIIVQSNGTGTARTITCNGTVTASYVDFVDITGVGSASWNLASITGGSSDGGGNSGITFTTAATQYRVGAGGNWSATANWGSTDGGTGGTGRVPLLQDTAQVDSYASGTISCDCNRVSAVTFAGFTGTFSQAVGSGNNLIFFGSVTFVSGMTVSHSSGNNGMLFYGRGNYTLTTGGITWYNGMAFSFGGFHGTYVLGDNINTGSNNTGGLIISNACTVDNTVNNVNVTIPGWNIGSNSILKMGSGTFTLVMTGTIAVTATGTINAGTSTVIISDTSSSNKTFGSSSSTNTFYNFMVNGGGTGYVELLGTNTFNGTFTINAPKTFYFQASTTTTFAGMFIATGSSGNIITILSSTAGTQATLSKSSGIVSCNYLSLQYSNATGGATWYAGNASTNVSDNTGWIFSNLPSGSNLLMMGVG